jgi:hypothetical protein
VLLLVIAEDALVPHRQLDALAAPEPAIDEVADKDDAIAGRDCQTVQQFDGLVMASVEVAHHDRAGWGGTHILFVLGFEPGGVPGRCVAYLS